jgi:hypothetical protein
MPASHKEVEQHFMAHRDEALTGEYDTDVRYINQTELWWLELFTATDYRLRLTHLGGGCGVGYMLVWRNNTPESEHYFELEFANNQCELFRVVKDKDTTHDTQVDYKDMKEFLGSENSKYLTDFFSRKPRLSAHDLAFDIQKQIVLRQALYGADTDVTELTNALNEKMSLWSAIQKDVFQTMTNTYRFRITRQCENQT